MKQLRCLTDPALPSERLRRHLIRALVLSPFACGVVAVGESGQVRAQAGTTKTPTTESPVTDVPMTDAQMNHAAAYSDQLVIDHATGRKIGVRIRLPAQEKSSGLILYSPGLGSGLSNGAAWCAAWQAAGYVVVNLAHPVTDDSIWNTARTSFQENLKRALSPEQYTYRVKDCSAVLTHYLKDPALKHYIDPNRIGIAGHSYGALTVQAITGQLVGGQDLRDPRIRAAIAFSPGAVSAERAHLMAKVKIPFFSITGDHDQFVTFKDGQNTMRLGMALEKRLLIYEQLPAGHKQLLILANADHMTFAGEAVDPSRFSRDVTLGSAEQLGQWSRISEMSHIFWKYYLSDSINLSAENQMRFNNELSSRQIAGDVLKFG